MEHGSSISGTVPGVPRAHSGNLPPPSYAYHPGFSSSSSSSGFRRRCCPAQAAKRRTLWHCRLRSDRSWYNGKTLGVGKNGKQWVFTGSSTLEGSIYSPINLNKTCGVTRSIDLLERFMCHICFRYANTITPDIGFAKERCGKWKQALDARLFVNHLPCACSASWRILINNGSTRRINYKWMSVFPSLCLITGG